MYRSLAFLVLVVLTADVCGEIIDGKVKEIDLKKRTINVIKTGIAPEPENGLAFSIPDGATIESDDGEKRVPLPKGLADIRIGDSVSIYASTSGVSRVVRRDEPAKKK